MSAPNREIPCSVQKSRISIQVTAEAAGWGFRCKSPVRRPAGRQGAGFRPESDTEWVIVYHFLVVERAILHARQM